MTISRRGLLGLAALPGLAAPALAQTSWPQGQPIRFVVPFGAGTSTDILARMLAAAMSRRIGQTIVVDNRPGAGGTLGTGQVARAAPDGYTLLLASISTMAVGKVLYGERVTWDPDRDFAHVAIVSTTPYMILVRPDSPFRTLADLVAEARRRPDTLSYGTSGVGSMLHLVMVRFLSAAGISMTHVPYRVSTQGHADLAAGVLPVMADALTAVSGHIRSGALRPLAQSGRERIPDFPDIPTFRELGYADLVVDGWNGIALPAATPRPIQERLAAVTREALNEPEVTRQFAETAFSPARLFLEDAQRFVREEIAVWAPIVRASDAKVE